MSSARNSVLGNIKRSLPRDKNKRLLVLVLALILLPITVVVAQRVIRYFSGAASATLSFSAASTTLPPNQTVRLMVNSGTTQVGFARVVVKYDPAKIRLASEATTSNLLTMNNADVPTGTALPQYACTGTMPCIIKTPMSTTNTLGLITLVLAKDPRNTTLNPPSGTFELANFIFSTVTTAQTTTQVSVDEYQLVDMNSGQFTVTTQAITLNLNPGGPTVTVAPTVTLAPTQPPGNITNLVVNDTNAPDWSIRTNLQVGDVQYGDRSYTFTTIPTEYRGFEWIRTANDSKAYTETILATFKVKYDSVVYIAHDDRYTTKPTWLAGWTDTGSNILNSDAASPPPVFSLYSKNFTSGSTITLGPNGGSGFSMYTVLVKTTDTTPPSTPTPRPTNTPIPTVIATIIPTPRPTNTPIPTNTPGPTSIVVSPTPPQCFIVGDANGDCCVNFIDYAIWRLNFGNTTTNGARDGDFNNDTRVDFIDYALWRNNFGTCTQP